MWVSLTTQTSYQSQRNFDAQDKGTLLSRGMCSGVRASGPNRQQTQLLSEPARETPWLRQALSGKFQSLHCLLTSVFRKCASAYKNLNKPNQTHQKTYSCYC